MATINEIFTKAKDHLRAIAGETMAISVRENKKLINKLEELQKEKEKLIQSKDKDKKERYEAILSEINAVKLAIEDKEVVKSVKVENNDEVVKELKEITATLKEEVRKFDKEVIVSNEFDDIIEALNTNNNTKEVIEALSRVEEAINGIEKPEMPHIVDTTDVLLKIVDGVNSKEALRDVLEEIRDKETIFPSLMPVELDPRLIDDNRLRTVLPDEQVDLMSKVVTGGGIKNVFLENNNGRISQDNPLAVREWSKVSTLNSTMETLDAGEVFTGEWEEILQYSVLLVGVKSDVTSAIDGLSIQFSPDGSNYVNSDEYTIPANSGKTFSFQPCGRYFRVVYTNGGTEQTSFSIESILKSDYVKPSSHRIQDSIIEDDDAELVKSVITGLGENGVFSNAKVSSSGRLKVVSQPYTYAIAEGDVLGHRPLRRFGHNPSVGTSLETVSNDSVLYTYLTSAEYLRIVSTSASDDIAGVGMRSIFIQGLDGDYNIVNEVVELDGTTPVYTTTHQYIRLLAAYGSAVGTTPGNVGIVTISNNAGTNILGTLPVGEGRWNSAIVTVPAGGTIYITDWYGSENSSKGSEISLWKREFGDGGWQLLRLYTLLDNVFENEIKTPLSFTEKTDIEIRAKSSLGGANIAAGFYGWIE